MNKLQDPAKTAQIIKEFEKQKLNIEFSEDLSKYKCLNFI